MKLFGPSLSCVQMAKEQHHKGGKLALLDWRDGVSDPGFCKNPGGNVVGAEVRIALLQTVVRNAATVLVEKVVALPQRGEKRIEISNIHVGGRCQRFHPGVETLRFANRQRAIGPKRR